MQMIRVNGVGAGNIDMLSIHGLLPKKGNGLLIIEHTKQWKVRISEDLFIEVFI